MFKIPFSYCSLTLLNVSPSSSPHSDVQDIGVFVNLTVLSLDNNQLTQVPAEIGVLLKLRSLRLCYNQLTSLPPVLGQLLECKCNRRLGKL